MDPFYPFEIKKPAKNALNNRFDFQYPIIITSWPRERDVLRYLSKVEGNGIRDSSSLFFIQPRIVREFAGCGATLAGNFYRGLCPGRRPQCMHKTSREPPNRNARFIWPRGCDRTNPIGNRKNSGVGRSVGRPVFIFVSPLGPRTRRRAEKSFVRYHLHFARFVLVTSDRL